jgi:hypothetical protein
MASRIPDNAPQITCHQLALFCFYPECPKSLASFEHYCIELRLTDLLLYFHDGEVLTLDLILYLECFLICFMFHSPDVIPPRSNIVVRAGSRLETWVFVGVFPCCAVLIMLYVDIILNPKNVSRETSVIE